MNETTAGLITYLTEFRRRLLICLIFLLIIFLILCCFSNQIYTFLALPLLKHLPRGQSFIATDIVSPFFVPFELTWTAALFFCVPFFLYQCWAFVAPALYRRERKMIWPLLLMSILLFYMGVAFAYFIIFPILFAFLTHSAPNGVIVSPDMGQYLDFSLKLLLVFGFIFEVPVITILLISSGIVSREMFIKMRPYAIVGAFIIGMFFAPPDVMSQTLLAIPLWLLFEVGILVSHFFVKKIKRSKEKE